MILLAIVAYPALAVTTWLFFAAIVQLRNRRSSLTPMSLFLGKAIGVIGCALDFLFNVASSVVFLDIPREWLFTARVKRHVNQLTWRGNLARWFRDNWLDCVDPDHCK